MGSKEFFQLTWWNNRLRSKNGLNLKGEGLTSGTRFNQQPLLKGKAAKTVGCYQHGSTWISRGDRDCEDTQRPS